MEVLKGETVAGQFQADGAAGWQNVSATLDLAAGPQKLRVRAENGSQAIHWIEFRKK